MKFDNGDRKTQQVTADARKYVTAFILKSNELAVRKSQNYFDCELPSRAEWHIFTGNTDFEIFS